MASITRPEGGRKHFYGSTREEVQKKLGLAIHARDTGTLADARGLSTGDYLDRWLTDVIHPNVRPSTFKGYEVHVRLHLKPALGRIPLGSCRATWCKSSRVVRSLD